MEKNIMNELYFGTGASSNKSYEGLFQVVETAVKQGIVHFDTAPSYRTEDIQKFRIAARGRFYSDQD